MMHKYHTTLGFFLLFGTIINGVGKLLGKLGFLSMKYSIET